MIKLNEAVIVEGKYDKIKLSGIIDALIIETNGFRIFKDKKKLNFIRRLAVSKGIIILTDSDSAGFLIRNYLNSSISEGRVIHAYIPDIIGKEKRKVKASKESKIGVEGMDEENIKKSINMSGALIKDLSDISDKKSEDIKFRNIKLKFYELGYCGNKFSQKKRTELKESLKIPQYLSTNALIKLLSKCFTEDELEKIL